MSSEPGDFFPSDEELPNDEDSIPVDDGGDEDDEDNTGDDDDEEEEEEDDDDGPA